jgi:hypothetical protein
MQTRIASVSREDNPFRNLTELHLHGGTFTSIGGDMINNHYHTHYHPNPSNDPSASAPKVDVLAILKAVSNQRKLQQDTLGKATPKTGGWMLKHEKLAMWQDPKSGLDMMCGSGMREQL